jgi:TRAP-type C4-dicarboxylate transport system permease small subunit
MLRALDGYRRLLGLVGLVERVLIVLLILNIVVNIGVQVFSRYVMNQPLIWVEELATYSFIWATFLGASLGLKHQRHVKIETFVGWLPAMPRHLLRAATMAVVLTLALALLPEAWTVVTIESRRTSIALPVQLPMALFFSVPLFVGFASMALTALYLALAELHAAATGTPPRPIFERAVP